MIEFGGWQMPVLYTGVVEEHNAVRKRAGLFDVSHMGEIRLRGRDALQNIQRLTTNDAASLEVGRARYTLMTDTAGGIIDDLLVYRLGSLDYLLVVNAGTTAEDVAWVREHARGEVEVEDESEQWALLALQGPRSSSILRRILPEDVVALRYYRFCELAYEGVEMMVSRTGYTGEDGFEIYLSPDRVVELASALLKAGAADGLQPAGLGARDTLRLEAGLLLYGNDMDRSCSPLEAGLERFVKLDKGDFIGRGALQSQALHGVGRRLVGMQTVGRDIPRRGYRILASGGEAIGEVTSGTFSPTLRRGIGLGLVEVEVADAGTELAIERRDRRLPAVVVETPFYRRTASSQGASHG